MNVKPSETVVIKKFLIVGLTDKKSKCSWTNSFKVGDIVGLKFSVPNSLRIRRSTFLFGKLSNDSVINGIDEPRYLARFERIFILEEIKE